MEFNLTGLSPHIIIMDGKLYRIRDEIEVDLTEPSLVPFDPDQFNGDSNEDFSEEEDDSVDELAKGDVDVCKSSDKGKVPEVEAKTIAEKTASGDVSVM